MDGFWLILKNSADCEIDRYFVATVNDSLPLPANDMFSKVDWYLNDGDTIRIESGSRQ